MIELIFKDRCSGCGSCVRICPSNALGLDTDSKPLIRDQAACQTCFMCELYCTADALYVDPDCEHPVALNAPEIRESGLLGQYRRDSGWDEWAAEPRYANQHWRMDTIFALGYSLLSPAAPSATGETDEKR
ncbi:ferredoxin family protein [Azotobacter sp. CWF10]